MNTELPKDGETIDIKNINNLVVTTKFYRPEKLLHGYSYIIVAYNIDESELARISISYDDLDCMPDDRVTTIKSAVKLLHQNIEKNLHQTY